MTEPKSIEDQVVEAMARSLFAVANSGLPADQRQTAWQASRREHFAQAKRLLRQMSAKGLVVTKSEGVPLSA